MPSWLQPFDRISLADVIQMKCSHLYHSLSISIILISISISVSCLSQSLSLPSTKPVRGTKGSVTKVYYTLLWCVSENS